MRCLVARAAIFTLLALTATAHAAGSEARFLAATLVVMQGDLQRLDEPATTAQQAAGLRERLAGALAALALPLRQRGDRVGAADLPVLREALRAADWAQLRAGITRLQQRHPFHVDFMMTGQTAAIDAHRRLGETIHRQQCAGCHEAPATDARLPARNLFDEARRLPPAEFAARLLTGLHGDARTAWRNPFSDLELGALQHYYRNGPPAR